jgi:hypothetical protein
MRHSGLISADALRAHQRRYLLGPGEAIFDAHSSPPTPRLLAVIAGNAVNHTRGE